MRTLAKDVYLALIRDSHVLSRDRHGIKVLLLPDATILKLFRRKRFLSSALLWPYARRFVWASLRLQALGIPTVEVRAIYRIPDIQRDAVLYSRLEGVGLREVVTTASTRNEALRQLARFLASLHARGVYFRAIHIGNILLTPAKGLGLIDISETRFVYGGLSSNLRARNFGPLVKYAEDAAALREFGLMRFVREYLTAAGMVEDQRTRFLSALCGIKGDFAEVSNQLVAFSTGLRTYDWDDKTVIGTGVLRHSGDHRFRQ